MPRLRLARLAAHLSPARVAGRSDDAERAAGGQGELGLRPEEERLDREWAGAGKPPAFVHPGAAHHPSERQELYVQMSQHERYLFDLRGVRRPQPTPFHVAHPAPLPPAAPLARILPRVATSSSQPHHTDDTLQFIHVRGFLTPDEVAAMNAALDANMSLRSDFGPTNDALANTPLAGTHSVFRHWNDLLTMPQPHCLPFRELMAHPKLVPYLNDLLGRGWKFDHGATIHSQEAGSEGLRLHGDGNA